MFNSLTHFYCFKIAVVFGITALSFGFHTILCFSIVLLCILLLIYSFHGNHKHFNFNTTILCNNLELLSKKYAIKQLFYHKLSSYSIRMPILIRHCCCKLFLYPSMENSEKYHPILFSKDQEATYETKKEVIIPQATLYETPIQTHNVPAKKHLVIFGFSSSNKKYVMDHIYRLVNNFKKEEGKNYIKIWSDDMSSLDEVLKLNHKLMNGEIIGVYKQNYGIIEDNDIYVRKPGIFRIFFEYLFG